MTQTINEESQNKLSELDVLVGELAQKIMGICTEYSTIATEKLGSEFKAGLMPFSDVREGGWSKPAVKVVILPVKKQEDVNQETVGGAGEGTDESAGAEESTETSTTTG